MLSGVVNKILSSFTDKYLHNVEWGGGLSVSDVRVNTKAFKIPPPFQISSFVLHKYVVLFISLLHIRFISLGRVLNGLIDWK